MTRRILVLLGVLVLVVGVASAQSNRERVVPGETTTLTTIGTCQPETDLSAVGWDQTPTSGSWGGRPESDFAVVWEPGFADVPDYPAFSGGRFAACTIAGATGKVPKKIEMEVLEGLANDDYCVFASVGAGDLLIGCKNESSASEVWAIHSWDLPPNAFASGQDLTVTIIATGNAWPSFATWGQLAVDYIEVKGE